MPKAIGQPIASISRYVQIWVPSNFALPALRESTEVSIPTDLKASTVLRIPQKGRHLLTVKANWLGTYIITEVRTIRDYYIVQLHIYTGTISVLGVDNDCVDDVSSEAGENDTKDNHT